MAKSRTGVLLGLETARRVLKLTGQKTQGKIPEKVKRRSEVGLRFFVLLEDMQGNGPAKADWVARTNNTSRGVFDVYGYDSILDGAMAGYKGIYALIDGEWVICANACITACETSGTLSVGSPPSGTVGVAYTHTVSGTNLETDPFAASNLPPGLTINATTGEVSGTPTTAGTYLVIVTATAPKTGAPGETCTLTRAVEIVIEEAV